MSGHAPANLPGIEHGHSHASHGHASHHAHHDGHHDHDAHEHDHHAPKGAAAIERPYLERLLEILAEPIWKLSGDFERRNNAHDAHHH